MHGREAVQKPMRVRQARRVKKCGGWGPLHQSTGVHHRDVIGQLDEQRQVMSDEEGGESKPVTQSHQLLEDLALGDHVERGGRLVEDHDLRLQGERHGDHRPLPHAP